MTNPEPKCPVCGEGGPFERHGHPRRENFEPPTPGLASISDEKVLWLFDQLAAERAARERAEARIVSERGFYEAAVRDLAVACSRAERAEARVLELEDLIVTLNAPEQCPETCTCGYGCPHGAGCLSICSCEEWEPPNAVYDEARAILARKGESK